MKKIKYNLKEMMADIEKDEAASKPVHKIISQDAIAEMLKKTQTPTPEPKQHGK